MTLRHCREVTAARDLGFAYFYDKCRILYFYKILKIFPKSRVLVSGASAPPDVNLLETVGLSDGLRTVITTACW